MSLKYKEGTFYRQNCTKQDIMSLKYREWTFYRQNCTTQDIMSLKYREETFYRWGFLEENVRLRLAKLFPCSCLISLPFLSVM